MKYPICIFIPVIPISDLDCCTRPFHTTQLECTPIPSLPEEPSLIIFFWCSYPNIENEFWSEEELILASINLAVVSAISVLIVVVINFCTSLLLLRYKDLYRLIISFSNTCISLADCLLALRNSSILKFLFFINSSCKVLSSAFKLAIDSSE